MAIENEGASNFQDAELSRALLKHLYPLEQALAPPEWYDMS
jgi:hypothetical protein